MKITELMKPPMYVPRLFDMLLGDWDRHQDQWRWAAFKEDGVTTYRPVPRDRDQAFSIMNDGFVLGLATVMAASSTCLKFIRRGYKDVHGVILIHMFWMSLVIEEFREEQFGKNKLHYFFSYY